MFQVLPVLLKDGYKVGHKFQYPKGTTLIYSNFTPRASRVDGVDGIVAFGLQYFVQEYLMDQFHENFFDRDKDYVLKVYKRRIDNYLGPGAITFDHIADLHDVGYLPLHIKAVPEGTIVPFRVPVFTLYNTIPEFYWLTNMLETLMSNILWQPMTSATTAFRYRRAFEQFATLTGADKAFIPWQGHDFSFRGMGGIESACLSGAAHLLSFTGTDTIPAIDLLEQYYGADCEQELIGGSVPATEHSVMSMGMKDGERETFKRLITEVYPKGIVSIVSDTWDFWKVLLEYLPSLRSSVMEREGKVVIRPDSGDPVKVICGDPEARSEHERKGAIQVLWETFGGTYTNKGFKVLDPHIGLIYGDSITPERQAQILARLAANGFASSNVVLGIGSYTYQYVTRDTFGFAMKATYGERARPDILSKFPGSYGVEGQAIYKEPKTDDGVKNSAKGLLEVVREEKVLVLKENVSWEDEKYGVLQTIFRNGIPHNIQTLKQIREVLASQL
jgi:nicotinamide phosphoribosyltransferase